MTDGPSGDKDNDWHIGLKMLKKLKRDKAYNCCRDDYFTSGIFGDHDEEKDDRMTPPVNRVLGMIPLGMADIRSAKDQRKLYGQLLDIVVTVILEDQTEEFRVMHSRMYSPLWQAVNLYAKSHSPNKSTLKKVIYWTQFVRVMRYVLLRLRKEEEVEHFPEWNSLQETKDEDKKKGPEEDTGMKPWMQDHPRDQLRAKLFQKCHPKDWALSEYDFKPTTTQEQDTVEAQIKYSFEMDPDVAQMARMHAEERTSGQFDTNPTPRPETKKAKGEKHVSFHPATNFDGPYRILGRRSQQSGEFEMWGLVPDSESIEDAGTKGTQDDDGKDVDLETWLAEKTNKKVIEKEIKPKEDEDVETWMVKKHMAKDLSEEEKKGEKEKEMPKGDVAGYQPLSKAVPNNVWRRPRKSRRKKEPIFQSVGELNGEKAIERTGMGRPERSRKVEDTEGDKDYVQLTVSQPSVTAKSWDRKGRRKVEKEADFQSLEEILAETKTVEETGMERLKGKRVRIQGILLREVEVVGKIEEAVRRASFTGFRGKEKSPFRAEMVTKDGYFWYAESWNQNTKRVQFTQLTAKEKTLMAVSEFSRLGQKLLSHASKPKKNSRRKLKNVDKSLHSTLQKKTHKIPEGLDRQQWMVAESMATDLCKVKAPHQEVVKMKSVPFEMTSQGVSKPQIPKPQRALKDMLKTDIQTSSRDAGEVGVEEVEGVEKVIDDSKTGKAFGYATLKLIFENKDSPPPSVDIDALLTIRMKKTCPAEEHNN